jgi:hypothetical protein
MELAVLDVLPAATSRPINSATTPRHGRTSWAGRKVWAATRARRRAIGDRTYDIKPAAVGGADPVICRDFVIRAWMERAAGRLAGA